MHLQKGQAGNAVQAGKPMTAKGDDGPPRLRGGPFSLLALTLGVALQDAVGPVQLPLWFREMTRSALIELL